jgi:hypothetical protein
LDLSASYLRRLEPRKRFENREVTTGVLERGNPGAGRVVLMERGRVFEGLGAAPNRAIIDDRFVDPVPLSMVSNRGISTRRRRCNRARA